MNLARLSLAAALTALLVAPASAQDAPAPAADVVRAFAADVETVGDAVDLPFSAARHDRMDAFLADWETRLASRPRETATADAVDRVLLAGEIAHRRRELPFARRRDAESTVLAPFAAELVALEDARRKLCNRTPKDSAETLDRARRAVEEVRAKVERGLAKDAGKDAASPPADAVVASPTVAFRTAARLGRLRETLKRWFDDRDGFEPEFAWWVRKPWAALDQALEGYAKFLREKVAGATDDGGGPLIGDPIGRDALVADLAHEMVPYSPEEVLAIADREMAWCEAEAKAVATRMGFDGDWRKALAKAKANHVAPGRQCDLVAEQAREAIEFVTSRDLVTVPPLCRELWGLHMIPEAAQRTMPYAYYSGRDMGVAYPSDAMEHERKLMSMRGNNVHFSRIVTPHELIPGHHLQMFQAARHRAYRELFRTPFLVEGWALYWEMRLWDLGWAKSDEDRVGMLFWRMHRCARITVSLKFHLGQMTPQQMVDFLVDRVGHERDGATAEVRRYVAGGYGPLYQAAYMLGGLQLRALHGELVATKRMSERDFHDAVLRENSIPVRMIRFSLLGESLGADGAVAPWRFAGEAVPATTK